MSSTLCTSFYVSRRRWGSLSSFDILNTLKNKKTAIFWCPSLVGLWQDTVWLYRKGASTPKKKVDGESVLLLFDRRKKQCGMELYHLVFLGVNRSPDTGGATELFVSGGLLYL